MRRTRPIGTTLAAGVAVDRCVRATKDAVEGEPIAAHPRSGSTTPLKIELNCTPSASPISTNCEKSFYTIPELAERWHCSRGKVYIVLRGEVVIDFAPSPGRKGHKLVSAEVVRHIENRRARRLT